MLRQKPPVKVPLWGTLTSKETHAMLVELSERPSERITGNVTLRSKFPFAVQLKDRNFTTPVVTADPHIDNVFQAQIPFVSFAAALTGSPALIFTKLTPNTKTVVNIHISLRKTKGSQKGSSTSGKMKGKAAARLTKNKKKQKGYAGKKKMQRGKAAKKCKTKKQKGKAAARKKGGDKRKVGGGVKVRLI